MQSKAAKKGAGQSLYPTHQMHIKLTMVLLVISAKRLLPVPINVLL